MSSDRDKNYQESLINSGLSQQEAEVYLALLEIGESTVLPISKKSGVHRTFCYEVLDDLAKKGLVSFVEKRGRRHYNASDPTNIQLSMRESEKKFSAVLPDLLDLYQGASEKPRMRFFEGHKGIKSVYEEVVREAREIWFIGSAEAWMKELPNYADLTREQVRKKIKIRDLTTRSSIIEDYSKYYTDEQELRYLPDNVKFTTDNIIWGNKIAMVSFSGEKHAVVIESEEIAKTMKEFFEVLWTMSSKK